MLERFGQDVFDDITLTAGLSDEDASELVSWLVGVAEDLEPEFLTNDPSYVLGQLKRMGREIAQLSRQYKIPIETLVDLVETAWDFPAGDEPKAMQA
jgi:hypothetical protein